MWQQIGGRRHARGRVTSERGDGARRYVLCRGPVAASCSHGVNCLQLTSRDLRASGSW